MKLKEGDAAPDFVLPDTEGNRVKLSSFRGGKVVLYFYPKDDTTGCMREACSFRDNFSEFGETVILGVSMDGAESHRKFSNKYSLPFTLLSDEDGKVIKKYGAWGEKNMYGRKYMGILRTTFIIDEQGRIKKIFRSVKPDSHSSEVLEALD